MNCKIGFFLCLCCCQIAGAQDGKLEINHLTGDFHIFTTYQAYKGTLFPANGMYLVADSGVVLFDTPWDSTQFQALSDSIFFKHKKRIKLCISTHYHADRTAGLVFYREQGARTFTSKQTLELCKKHGEVQSEFVFTRDTLFRFGQYSFRTFFPGAGHTMDNQTILFDKEKIIYGGCFVKSTESKGMGNVMDADLAAWSRSIKRLKKEMRRPKYIIPGHQDWQCRKSLKHTLRLLKKYKPKDGGR